MTKRYSLEVVVVVVLFVVYAICAMLLSMIGANIYKSTASSMEQNYNQRTSVLYVMEKVRQFDNNDSVHVDDAFGSDALVLTERYSGRGTQTWLFVHDGVLYEKPHVDPLAELDLSQAQEIMALSSMEISVDSNNPKSMHIVFTLTDGEAQQIDVMCRCDVIEEA